MSAVTEIMTAKEFVDFMSTIGVEESYVAFGMLMDVTTNRPYAQVMTSEIIVCISRPLPISQPGMFKVELY